MPWGFWNPLVIAVEVRALLQVHFRGNAGAGDARDPGVLGPLMPVFFITQGLAGYGKGFDTGPP